MTNSLTPEQLDRLQRAVETIPYARLLGIHLDRASSATATLSLRVRSELTQPQGVVHGGAIASLIDTAMAFAIITLLEPGEKVTTVDLTVSFLRPVTEGQMVATAQVKRSGRRLFAVSADVTDAAGKPVATALSTYIRL